MHVFRNGGGFGTTFAELSYRFDPDAASQILKGNAMRIVVGSLVVGLVLLASLQLFSPPGPTVTAGEDKAGRVAAAQDDEASDSPLAAFMHAKLDASNRILEGLVTDEMKKVQSGADELLQMSDAEQWRASNDMLYLQHSRTFRESVVSLRDKAGKGSVDGVALAWMDVTLNCIRCHEWVRNVMVAEGATLSDGLLDGR